MPRTGWVPHGSRIEVEHVLGEGDGTVAQLAWSATLTRRRLRVVDRMCASWADGRLIAEWHEGVC
jgi:hypothetical protein